MGMKSANNGFETFYLVEQETSFSFELLAVSQETRNFLIREQVNTELQIFCENPSSRRSTESFLIFGHILKVS